MTRNIRTDQERALSTLGVARRKLDRCTKQHAAAQAEADILEAQREHLDDRVRYLRADPALAGHEEYLPVDAEPDAADDDDDDDDDKKGTD